MKSRLLKNKGFTLAELLIAVVVLAFGAVPILANFVQSGTMNKKAKISLNATNMAQDVMEGMSAYTATDVISMFESEEDLMGKILPSNVKKYESHGDCDVTSGGIWTSQYTATRDSFDLSQNAQGSRQYAKKVENGVTTEVDKLNNTDNYYFFVKGLEQGNNKYDLQVTLSAGQYADNKGVLGDKTDNINDNKNATILEVEQPYDAVQKISNSDYEQAVAKFKKESGNPSAFNTDDYHNYIKREIEIRIEDPTPSDGVTNYKVGTKATYTFDSSKLSAYGLDASSQEVVTFAKDNISLLEPDKLNRSIYIYYEGLPGSTSLGGGALDNFSIYNTTGKRITVYLIRTIEAPTSMENLTDETDSTYNANYRSNVNVISTEDDGNTTNKETLIVSNMRENLSAKYEDRYSSYNADRCNFVYNATLMTENEYGTPYGSENDSAVTYKKGWVVDENTPNELKVFSDGYQVQLAQKVYSVKIEVWDAKTNKKVATFNGGLSD